MPTLPNQKQATKQLPSEAGNLNVVVLAGGVGGARLADGLAQLLPPEKLTVIVNTGDDFQHLGLTICPDLDTVMYTLAGVVNPDNGWGRAGESWQTIAEVERLGGPAWFRLGDLDLATHLVRSHALADGRHLTAVTQDLCRQFGVAANILPMSNQPAPTFIETDMGLLSFQDWFVRRQWQPAVRQIRLPEDVRATPHVLAALEKANLVVIAPSNPFVSVDPILNVYPIRAMIADLPDLVIAVSPIIGGQAVKGPAAKMMPELGMEASAAGVAHYYHSLIDVFIYDQSDAALADNLDLERRQRDILMRDRADRRRLAHEIMAIAMELLQS